MRRPIRTAILCVSSTPVYCAGLWHEPLTVLAALVGAEKKQIPSQAMEVETREVTPQL